jgi:26S proteasome regulatory subunit T3
MADVAVETPPAVHKKAMAASIPTIDSLDGISGESSDEYSELKKLQRHLE